MESKEDGREQKKEKGKKWSDKHAFRGLTEFPLYRWDA